MEKPQFSASDGLEEYSAQPTEPKDAFKNELPEDKLLSEVSQEEPKITGWKAIQKARKRRQYGSQQTSSPSHPDDKSCIHHWRIEEVQGPISMGSCLDCSATKEFKNWTDELDGFISYERQYGTNKH